MHKIYSLKSLNSPSLDEKTPPTVTLSAEQSPPSDISRLPASLNPLREFVDPDYIKKIPIPKPVNHAEAALVGDLMAQIANSELVDSYGNMSKTPVPLLQADQLARLPEHEKKLSAKEMLKRNIDRNVSIDAMIPHKIKVRRKLFKKPIKNKKPINVIIDLELRKKFLKLTRKNFTNMRYVIETFIRYYVEHPEYFDIKRVRDNRRGIMP